MTTQETVIFFAIHFLIPVAGILLFFYIKKRMRTDAIAKAPLAELFLLLASYGILLITVHTALFWEWSGMASLGIFYLILIAPIIMAVIAYRQQKNSALSAYHRWILISAIAYYVITPLTFWLMFVIITG